MRSHLITSLLLALLTLSACKSQKPEYSRPLPPGASALRKLDHADWPDLRYALPMDDAFVAATKRSLAWFAKPSTKGFYPIDGISHDQARASVYALPNVAWDAGSTEAFIVKMHEEFDIYTSVGWDGSGTLLFTGYYSPIFQASKTRTAEFRFPLYKRPADLVADPVTGEVKGRQHNGAITTYPSRSELEAAGSLAGSELVYLKSRLDAYIVEVQGSAKLTLPDGSAMLVGFAGSNGREYSSLGRMLAEEGKIDKDKISLPLIRDYFQSHPAELDGYIRRNDRFVFFTTYDSSDWPAGSLGVKVEPRRSIATDKTIFPRGVATLVVTKTAQSPFSGPGEVKPFHQLMMDQDTGGAIRAPGRADLYFGIGNEAEAYAGRQVAEGRLYYIILRPERVQHWLDRMQQAGGTVTPK
jgi:membrane-bound lytic murein transglycosylase A